MQEFLLAFQPCLLLCVGSFIPYSLFFFVSMEDIDFEYTIIIIAALTVVCNSKELLIYMSVVSWSNTIGNKMRKKHLLSEPQNRFPSWHIRNSFTGGNPDST
jgi:hypothetical protein